MMSEQTELVAIRLALGASTSVPMYDAFISYSRKDLAMVAQLKQCCDSLRLKVFFDSASLRAAEAWPAQIGDSIKHARLLTLCWSASAAASDWVQAEIRFALMAQKPIVPWRLDNAPPRQPQNGPRLLSRRPRRTPSPPPTPHRTHRNRRRPHPRPLSLVHHRPPHSRKHHLPGHHPRRTKQAPHGRHDPGRWPTNRHRHQRRIPSHLAHPARQPPIPHGLNLKKRLQKPNHRHPDRRFRSRAFFSEKQLTILTRIHVYPVLASWPNLIFFLRPPPRREPHAPTPLAEKMWQGRFSVLI